MNLLVSYDWLKKYVSLKETPEQFAARVSLSGPGVERLYPQAPMYEHMVVGHVRSVDVHPNADKLRLLKVDLGKQTATIVCGGANVKPSQWVVVALPGAKVRWHGEGDLIELKPTEIRGVASEGMVCAANEIGLFDAFPHGDHDILDLGEAFANERVAFRAGQAFAEFLGVENEVVMDVEITTNRPDAMGIVGVAREAAAILKRPFVWKAPRVKAGKEKLSVRVAEKKLCPRFTAVRIDGVKVGPSPWWLKRRLLSAGHRPINNVVDITNYILLELGRPMHVFDANKLTGGLQVRFAKPNESLKALDGKTYTLASHHLVVADDAGPQSIAGIMGGEESGATLDTTSIVFECAVWDPTHIRKTARELNLSSDSQSLFEKGLSTESTESGIARAIELCLEIAGGQVATQITDVQAQTYKPAVFATSLAEVRTLMGVELSLKEAKDTLVRLGFEVKVTGQKIQAKVPWWRDHDIEAGRDLIEEIARVYGYANIPGVYPPALAPKALNRELQLERELREMVKAAGYTEVLSYSFLSRELAEKAGFDPDKMLRVQNALSSDFEFMRTSLFPSLLQIIAENQERFRAQHLFEIANVYYLQDGQRHDLPREEPECVAAILGGDEASKEAKGLIEHVCALFGVTGVSWRPLEQDAFWHPGRTVQAFVGEHLIATLGEVHPLVTQRFKIEGRLAFAHLPLRSLFAVARSAKAYQPIPVFPEAKRDLACIVHRDVTVQAIEQVIRSASSLLFAVEWFDTYRGEGVGEDKKSLAFHLTFSVPDRTLEAEEVDAAMQSIEHALTNTFQAEWRR